uniref:Trio 2 salivary protein n=1 Tax=Anopheles funestus TaxID=62324 RepID=Q06DF4_ANOFN|nr:trio 2 salivary protein [Anopheles funestus]
MIHFESVLFILLLSVFAQLGHAVGADDPNEAKEVCGLKQRPVQDSIKGWLKAFENCPLHKVCEKKEHTTQFNQVRLRCLLAHKSKPKPAGTTGEVPGVKDLLPKIDTAMNNMKAMFEPTKADLVELDKVLDQQIREAWSEVAALQTEVFLSTLASGRIKRAVFYSILELGTNRKLDDRYQQSNVQELLNYAWALPLNTLQRNVYALIEKLVQTSKDPLLQTLYTVDVANMVNPALENQEKLINDHVQQLRDNIATNSFDTLISIARRFPERFAYLIERLFKLPVGTKPKADTLPNVVKFIGQLPMAQQRLKAVDGLLQSLTVKNGTLVSDVEYVYPLAKLAYDMQNLVVSPKKYQGADEMKEKFNTAVSGKSMQYYMQLFSNPPSSGVAA